MREIAAGDVEPDPVSPLEEITGGKGIDADTVGLARRHPCQKYCTIFESQRYILSIPNQAGLTLPLNFLEQAIQCGVIFERPIP